MDGLGMVGMVGITTVVEVQVDGSRIIWEVDIEVGGEVMVEDPNQDLADTAVQGDPDLADTAAAGCLVLEAEGVELRHRVELPHREELRHRGDRPNREERLHGVERPHQVEPRHQVELPHRVKRKPRQKFFKKTF